MAKLAIEGVSGDRPTSVAMPAIGDVV